MLVRTARGDLYRANPTAGVVTVLRIALEDIGLSNDGVELAAIGDAALVLAPDRAVARWIGPDGTNRDLDIPNGRLVASDGQRLQSASGRAKVDV